MKINKIFLFIAVGITLMGIATALEANNETLYWRPYCADKLNEPGNNWYESYDNNEINQKYCWANDTPALWIEQKTINIDGLYASTLNADAWTTVNYEKQQGNIRELEIYFEYYAPSHPSGQCIHNTINPLTGTYLSPQMILLTNKESNLSVEGTFDDAFYQFNNQILCDEWRSFSQKVKEFTNDFGSSFSGQSKSIGSVGFETKNMYIRELKIIENGVPVEVLLE